MKVIKWFLIICAIVWVVGMLVTAAIFLIPWNELKIVHISTAEDLLLLSDGGSFVLDNDIDCQGQALYGVIDFDGKIDGKGHVIKNVKFINPEDSNCIGLISSISDDVTIKNLGIENFTIDTNLAASNDRVFVGGLIAFGANDKIKIENCYVKGKINVDVNSKKIFIGGFVGYNDSYHCFINNCLSDVDINVNLDNSLFKSSEIYIAGFKADAGTCHMKNDIFVGSVKVKTTLEGSVGAKVVVGGLVGDAELHAESCLSLPSKIVCNSWLNETVGTFTNVNAGAIAGVYYTASEINYCYWCNYDDNSLEEADRVVQCTQRDIKFNSSGTDLCVKRSDMMTQDFMKGDYTFTDLNGSTRDSFLTFDEKIWNFGYYAEDGSFVNPSLKIFEGAN